MMFLLQIVLVYCSSEILTKIKILGGNIHHIELTTLKRKFEMNAVIPIN